MFSLAPKSRRGDVFRMFLVSYLAIVAATGLIGMAGYAAGIQIIRDEVNARNTAVLETARTILDNQLSDIGLLSIRIASGPTLNDIINLQGGFSTLPNPILIREFQNKLAYDYYKEGFVKHIWLYAPNLDALITPGSVYPKLSSIMNAPLPTLVYGKPENGYALLTETVFGQRYDGTLLPSINIIDIAGVYRSIPYVRSIPLGKDRVRATLMILIDQDYLLSYVKGLSLMKSGWFFIADGAGKILVSSRDDLESLIPFAKQITPSDSVSTYSQGAISYTVTTLHSLSHNLSYVVGVPTNELFEPVNRVRNLTVLALLGILVVGVIISLMFSDRYGRPIAQIETTLEDGSTRTGEGPTMRRLQTLAEDIMDRAHRLESNLDESRSRLREVAVHRLLQGSFGTEDEARQFWTKTGFPEDLAAGRVVYVKIPGFEGYLDKEDEKTLDDALDLTADELRRLGWQNLAYVGKNGIAVLAPGESSSSIESARSAYDRLLADFDLAPLFAFGNEYRGYRGIRTSYGEARLTMEYNESHGNARVFTYNEVPKPRGQYIYSLDQERRLMDGVKTGETRIVEDLLDELRKENLEGEPLTPGAQADLLGELRNTMIKLAAQVEGIVHPPELDRDENFTASFLALREAFLAAADIVHRSRSASYPVIRSVLDEMETDFGNQQLGLASLAEKYRISESYLSRLFKEVTGRNFHAYLNRLRMNKACELLEKTGLSVDEISVRAGYASTRVFRRAFKRDTGVAPSDYRSKNPERA